MSARNYMTFQARSEELRSVKVGGKTFLQRYPWGWRYGDPVFFDDDDVDEVVKKAEEWIGAQAPGYQARVSLHHRSALHPPELRGVHVIGEIEDDPIPVN